MAQLETGEVPWKDETDHDPVCEQSPVVLIRELVETVLQVAPDTPVRKIKELIDNGKPITAVVIVSGNRPVGLIMSIHLDRTLSQRFGVSLYYGKPVSKAMDTSPLLVEGCTPLERVADMAMARDRARVFDHIIVTEKGRMVGIVSVQAILNGLVSVQERNTKELNRINARLRKEIEEKKVAERDLLTLN